MEPDELRSAWRRRLAVVLRRFRRDRGRWPSRDIVSASKRGIAQAVAQGLRPPLEH